MGRAGALGVSGVTPPGRAWPLVSAAHFALCASLSCARFASDTDTLEAPEDQAAGVSDWDCPPGRAAAAAMTSTADRLDYSLRVMSLVSRALPVNLRVRACFMADLGCVQPLTPPLGPDSEGIVRVPLPVNFAGYLEVTSDDVSSSLVVFPTALSRAVAALLEEQPILLAPREPGTAFADALRTLSSPSTGTLVLSVLDCAGQGASGIRVLLDPPATPFSVIDGLPVAGRDTTTTYGVAGFFNVAPGVVVASGYIAATGEQVHQNALLVRAGWDSIASLLPVSRE